MRTGALGHWQTRASSCGGVGLGTWKAPLAPPSTQEMPLAQTGAGCRQPSPSGSRAAAVFGIRAQPHRLGNRGHPCRSSGPQRMTWPLSAQVAHRPVLPRDRSRTPPGPGPPIRRSQALRRGLAAGADRQSEISATLGGASGFPWSTLAPHPASALPTGVNGGQHMASRAPRPICVNSSGSNSDCA
jgi:hypothetical protein